MCRQHSIQFWDNRQRACRICLSQKKRERYQAKRRGKRRRRPVTKQAPPKPYARRTLRTSKSTRGIKIWQFAILRAARQAESRLMTEPALPEDVITECAELVRLGNQLLDRLDPVQVNPSNPPTSSPAHSHIHSGQLPG